MGKAQGISEQGGAWPGMGGKGMRHIEGGRLVWDGGERGSLGEEGWERGQGAA